MKRFSRYIAEKVVLPEPGKKLQLKRSEMPQINRETHKEFFAFLKKKGISTKQSKIDASTLKPSQSQFNKEKIQGMIDAIEDGSYKPKAIIVSKDNYVIDGHHTWIAHVNLNKPMSVSQVDVGAKELFNLMHEFPKSYTKTVRESTLHESNCDLIGMKQIKAFEKFVDRMFEKFGIDFNFTRHFSDRMSDDRNNPCITMQELADFIKKIYAKQGKSIKSIAGAEAVIKDLQSDLNIPIAVEYDTKNDEFDVVMKTVMRKKNFRTPNKVIKY